MARRFRGTVAKGYPKRAGKFKGKVRYRRHKGGKRYTAKQIRAVFATKGWKRAPRKSLRRRRRR